MQRDRGGAAGAELLTLGDGMHLVAVGGRGVAELLSLVRTMELMVVWRGVTSVCFPDQDEAEWVRNGCELDCS